MKQQSKKYLLLILLIAVLVAPTFTLASWHNPFSWNWNNIWNYFHQVKQISNPTVCPMFCLQNMICGKDGKDYCNECLLKTAGTTLAHEGRCNPTMVGGDRDSHGCIGSAGYTWCEAKQKCLRPWEEKCETTANPTAGWKTYTSSQYGFEFKYPKNYLIAPIKDTTYQPKNLILILGITNQTQKLPSMFVYVYKNEFNQNTESWFTLYRIQANLFGKQNDIKTDDIKIGELPAKQFTNTVTGKTAFYAATKDKIYGAELVTQMQSYLTEDLAVFGGIEQAFLIK